MSKKKAQKLSVRYKFEHDDAVIPAISMAFQEIVQWAQLYSAGDPVSRENCRKKLMEVSEAWIAWKFEEAQYTQSGFIHAEQVHAERQPEWDRWQQRAEEVYSSHPHWSKTQVCAEVAKEFGVVRKTVGNHVTEVGKPRKSRK